VNVSFAKYTKRMRLQDISRCPSMLSIGNLRERFAAEKGSGIANAKCRFRKTSFEIFEVLTEPGIPVRPGVVRKPTLPIKNKETWR